MSYWEFRSGIFDPAVKVAGLGDVGLTPHKLRHTAVPLAIASGADVKVVQSMLGHKSAAMTLDVYGHLFPDRLDEVADRLDAGRKAALGLFVVPAAQGKINSSMYRMRTAPPGDTWRGRTHIACDQAFSRLEQCTAPAWRTQAACGA